MFVQRLPTCVPVLPRPCRSESRDVAGDVGAELDAELDRVGISRGRPLGVVLAGQIEHGQLSETVVNDQLDAARERIAGEVLHAARAAVTVAVYVAPEASGLDGVSVAVREVESYETLAATVWA